MIETAMEMTDSRATAAEISEIVALGKSLLQHPVELLDGVDRDRPMRRWPDTDLVLITKGDLFHQEQKVAAVGPGRPLRADRDRQREGRGDLRRVLDTVGVAPRGLSSWSATRCGPTCCPCWPSAAGPCRSHQVTWSHEVVDHTADFPVLERLADLPAWLDAAS